MQTKRQKTVFCRVKKIKTAEGQHIWGSSQDGQPQTGDTHRREPSVKRKGNERTKKVPAGGEKQQEGFKRVF